MNNKLTPQQVLEELYKYFVLSLQKDYKIQPEHIIHISNMHQLLKKYIEKVEKVEKK